jgi:hypothetical protein
VSATRIYLYDSTLRDGGQTQGVGFSALDKADIALALDRFNISARLPSNWRTYAMTYGPRPRCL